MDIITIITIASIAAPFFGCALLLLERLLRMKYQEKGDEALTYVELPTPKLSPYHTYPSKARTTFLNTTLNEAASCNCPILCELLIEKGATELDKALDSAIQHGNIDICKILLNAGADPLLGLDVSIKTKNKKIENIIRDAMTKHR